MKENKTHAKRLKAGRPKTPGLKKRTTSLSGVSTNYKIMLELYCINKKEGLHKDELKYHAVGVRKGATAEARPSFSIAATILSFFEESLFFLRKSKAGMAMATVTE